VFPSQNSGKLNFTVAIGEGYLKAKEKSIEANVILGPHP